MAVFRFAIDYSYNAERPPSFPPKALTDRMMNVDFILDQATFDDNTRNGPLTDSPTTFKPLADNTMGRFTGNGISRKTCGVLLWAVEYEDQWNGWLSSPMASAISHMTGFDQITIEVEDQIVTLAHSWKLASQEDEEGELIAGSVEEEEESVAGNESPADKDGKRGSQDFTIEGITNCTWAFTHQIRNAFEDKLGPGEVTFMGTRPGIATSLSLQFRPQKHQSTARGTKRKQP